MCIQFQMMMENLLNGCQGNLKFSGSMKNGFPWAAVKCFMNSVECVSIYGWPCHAMLVEDIVCFLKVSQSVFNGLSSILQTVMSLNYNNRFQLPIPQHACTSLHHYRVHC
jgi:hypothetical protein